MRMVVDGLRRRRDCSLGLWPLFVAIIVLHAIVVQTQEVDDQSVICAADTVRASLLQVTSERYAQAASVVAQVAQEARPSVSTSQTSFARRYTGGKRHRGRNVTVQSHMPSKEFSHRGILTSLLAVAEAASLSTHSTPWLVVLLVVVIACLAFCGARFVNDSLDSNKGGRGARDASQTPSNAPAAYTRASSTTASLPHRSFTAAASLPPSRLPQQPQPVPSRVATPLMTPQPQTVLPHTSPMPSARVPAAGGSQREGLPMGPPVAGRFLCPGLVVPHGNECILAVPTLPSPGQTTLDVAPLNVQDLDGKSVIQAEVVMPHSARASVAMTQRPLVVLRAGSMPLRAGGAQEAAPLLAYAKASHEVGARKSVYIYDARDELFAQIVKDPANYRYVLTSGRIGLQLFFEGDLLTHNIIVKNEQHQLVAETTPAVMSFNPTGFYYKLRVVSNVDVGLILSALFAVDCLELS